ENRFNRDEILDVSRQSLENLGYWPLPAERAPAPVAEAAEAGEPVISEADIERTVAALIDRGAGVPAVEAAPDAPAPASGPDAPAAAPPATDGRLPAEATPAPATAGPGGFEATGDEIDDEIREVFLEEFAEEIDNLDQLLPLWRAQPDDLERLRPIRRVFHTLKGSGRLVGARTLGEFSWKIENMLNRVLDGSRPASPAVVAMVDQAFYTLPELQAALRGSGPVRSDLERMQASADRIAAGDESMPDEAGPTRFADAPAAVPPEAPAAPGAVEVAMAEPAAADTAEAAPAAGAAPAAPVAHEMVPASVDALLLEILDAEVAGHLATVDGWLAAASAAPAPASEALLRALHTMNGAFAMTEVPTVAQALTPAEGYVRRLLSAGTPASAEGVAAIGELVEVVRAAMAGLQSAQPRVPAAPALTARLAALRDRLPEPAPADLDRLAVGAMGDDDDDG